MRYLFVMNSAEIIVWTLWPRIMKVIIALHHYKTLIQFFLGTWYLEFAGTLQLLLTGSAMSIILVAYHCDLYIVLINSIDMGAERKTIQVVDISS